MIADELDSAIDSARARKEDIKLDFAGIPQNLALSASVRAAVLRYMQHMFEHQWADTLLDVFHDVELQNADFVDQGQHFDMTAPRSIS